MFGLDVHEQPGGGAAEVWRAGGLPDACTEQAQWSSQDEQGKLICLCHNSAVVLEEET